MEPETKPWGRVSIKAAMRLAPSARLRAGSDETDGAEMGTEVVVMTTILRFHCSGFGCEFDAGNGTGSGLRKSVSVSRCVVAPLNPSIPQDERKGCARR